MSWSLETSKGNEVRKVRDRITEYLKGIILDIGCGSEKVCSDAIGIDRFSEAANIHTDLSNPDSLRLFNKDSVDVVFSSHFLEDIYDYKSMLKEMWRILKPEGYLILYLPHKDLYPNIGEVGANVNHKHDFYPEDILTSLDSFASYKLIRNEVRSDDDEYSFELIIKKVDTGDIFLKLEPQLEKEYDKKNTVVVVRYGGIGDMLIVSPLYRVLKERGYYVIANVSTETKRVLDGNPYIDEFIVQTRYTIPNTQLKEYFDSLRKRYGTVINLCETLERSLLIEKEKDPELYSLPHEERHSRFNINYSDFVFQRAGVDITGLKPELYLTETERVLLNLFKIRHKDFFNIQWQASGSSWHKLYPCVSDVVDYLLDSYPDIQVFLTGGDNITLNSWDRPRLHNRILKWDVRQSIIATSVMDLVVSPETGVLNAAGAFEVPKIGLLTHSSKENLTKYFINDYSIQSQAPCSPCHKMIYELDECPLDQTYGLPICISQYMSKDKIISNIAKVYNLWKQSRESNAN